MFTKHRDKLTLFFFPLVLTSINSNWIFTPVTNYIPDPWFYFAYFRYFYKYAPVFPSTTHYFVERLSWNVPGYYIYQLFPPTFANYVLHLIVYYVAVFSLYGILKLLFNRRTALVSALLMGSYPWFLRAAGWDYPDGAGIAHMLLLLLLITWAHYSDKWKRIFLFAGIVHSSLLIMNPFWLGFFPAWAAYFLTLNHQTRKFRGSQLVFCALYFLIGSLSLVAVAAFFYDQATGGSLFFINSVRFSLSLPTDEANRVNIPMLYRSLRPYWHLLPAILVLLATWRILFEKNDRKDRSFLAVYLFFVAVYGWLLFWHITRIPLLVAIAYSSFALPATFLLLGGLLSGSLDRMSQKQFEIYTAQAVGVLLLPASSLRAAPGLESLQGQPLLTLILALIVLAVMFFRRTKISGFTVVVAMSLLFYFVSENSHVYAADPLKARNNFMAILSASDALDTYYPNHRYKDFRLWFRADGNYDTFFSLASLYLYPWGSALGKPYSGGQPPAKLSLAENDILQDGDNIVIISSDPESEQLLSEANQSARRQNARVRLITTKAIQEGSTRFFLYFTKVSSVR